MDTEEKLRLMELYCGIGGMRFALDEASIPYQVIAAIDINPVTNDIYQHNFGRDGHFQKNILSFSVNEIEKMKLDIITMSPPCQPFTRVGLKKDTADARCSSFLHILNILLRLRRKPMYLLLENVQGFEQSEARNILIDTLEKCGYRYQEFLLSPQDFLIPNSRLRYYMIAKLKEKRFSFEESKQILCEFPNFMHYMEFYCLDCCERSRTTKVGGCPIKHFLESKSNDYFETFLVPENILSKYWSVLDIVDENYDNTCCFTKAYHRYALGTGSVFMPLQNSKQNTLLRLIPETEDKTEQLNLLKQLKLRYFTPKEIANIMCFPNGFDFPSHIKDSQRYKAMGNSLNVFVVSNLLKLLLKDEEEDS